MWTPLQYQKLLNSLILNGLISTHYSDKDLSLAIVGWCQFQRVMNYLTLHFSATMSSSKQLTGDLGKLRLQVKTVKRYQSTSSSQFALPDESLGKKKSSCLPNNSKSFCLPAQMRCQKIQRLCGNKSCLCPLLVNSHYVKRKGRKVPAVKCTV